MFPLGLFLSVVRIIQRQKQRRSRSGKIPFNFKEIKFNSRKGVNSMNFDFNSILLIIIAIELVLIYVRLIVGKK